MLGLTSTLQMRSARLTAGAAHPVAAAAPGAGWLVLSLVDLDRGRTEQARRRCRARRARIAASGVDRVLDLGCGIGSVTLAFADAGLAVEAVDSRW